MNSADSMTGAASALTTLRKEPEELGTAEVRRAPDRISGRGDGERLRTAEQAGRVIIRCRDQAYPTPDCWQPGRQRTCSDLPPWSEYRVAPWREERASIA